MTPPSQVPADDFRVVVRTPVPWLLRGLAVATFSYGVMLTLFLPINLHAVLAERGMEVTGLFLSVLGVAFLLRWCVLQGLAFITLDRHVFARSAAPVLPTRYPFVSILVPAHDESDTIVSALNSLCRMDYPHYEVIVVDDGSNDDTYAKALPMAGDYGRCTVSVHTKPNGGKGSALNLAYAKSSGELVLCVDADSRLSEEALLHMVRRMEEPGVVGVCGQVAIRNRDRLLTRFQALEYLGGNGGMRAAMSALGTVTIVPGPIGLYRREILEQIQALPGNSVSHTDRDGEVAGPVSGETFAEDFQLSLSALALGGRIVYEPQGIAYTKCPDTIEILLSQRYRWMRGTFQVLRIYLRDLRGIALSRARRLDTVMLCIYPLDAYCTPVLNFAFWISLTAAAIGGLPLAPTLTWLAAVLILNVMTATVLVLAHDDEFTNVPLLVVMDLYQTILINSAWVIAAIDELRGTRMRWS